MKSLSPNKKLSALLFLILFSVPALLAGCAKQVDLSPPPGGVSRFPTGEPLQEGDILLARSYGLIGAMFANYSEEGGKFSHGSLVYRDPNTKRMMVLNYRPTGMEQVCTPEEYFTRYNRLALVRYKHDLDEARPKPETGLDPSLRGKDAISASAMRWLAKNKEKRIPPDYRLNHDDQEAMFCLELPSTAYRENNLPDPFFRARKADEDPLLIKANKMFKADVVEIRSPSSVLSNPDFVLVAEWLRPEYDLREEALNEELIAALIDDLNCGYMPGTPNFMGRMKIRQVLALYHVVTTLLFWMPKQDLPDFIDQEVIYNAYMLYSYVALSKKEAKKRMLAETLPAQAWRDPEEIEPRLAEVRKIVRETAACFRDKYMVYCGPETASGAMVTVLPPSP